MSEQTLNIAKKSKNRIKKRPEWGLFFVLDEVNRFIHPIYSSNLFIQEYGKFFNRNTWSNKGIDNIVRICITERNCADQFFIFWGIQYIQYDRVEMIPDCLRAGIQTTRFSRNNDILKWVF